MTGFVGATGHDLESRNAGFAGIFPKDIGPRMGHSDLAEASAQTTQQAILQGKA
jgi:hypothetical protein